MNAFIDWLQFTIKENEENEYELTYADVISHYLKLDVFDFTESKGMYGYKSCQHYQNIRVFYDGSIDMGIHVQISGKGCRYLEGQIDNFDWNDYLGWLVFCGVKFTRIDVAIDQTEYFNVDKIKKYIEKKRVVTRFRTYDPRSIKRIKDGESLSNTVYFGSRSSSLFIRIYDKGLETNGVIETTRLEIVMRDDRSNEFVSQYLKADNFYNLSYLTIKVLNNYLRFVNSDATRKERATVCKWWLDFIGHMEKISLGKGKGVITLEKVCKWFEKQVSSSLKLIIETKGVAYLDQMVSNAKLSKQQIKLKKEYEIQEAI